MQIDNFSYWELKALATYFLKTMSKETLDKFDKNELNCAHLLTAYSKIFKKLKKEEELSSYMD